jgi:hypothetical protein
VGVDDQALLGVTHEVALVRHEVEREVDVRVLGDRGRLVGAGGEAEADLGRPQGTVVLVLLGGRHEMLDGHVGAQQDRQTPGRRPDHVHLEGLPVEPPRRSGVKRPSSEA